MNTLRTALIQMRTSDDKPANLRAAAAWIQRAAAQQAALVMLPEMFCCPYSAATFPQYAEPEGGPVWQALAEAARANQVYLVGGSFPELDGGSIYNTCCIFDPRGRQIG
jgi:predicted amidohydrolase